MAKQTGKRRNLPLRIIIVLVLILLVAWVVWKNKDNMVSLWLFGAVPQIPVILFLPGCLLAGALLVYPLSAMRASRLRGKLREYERSFGPMDSGPSEAPYRSGESKNIH